VSNTVIRGRSIWSFCLLLEISVYSSFDDAQKKSLLCLHNH
jgi:hypothetical protein